MSNLSYKTINGISPQGMPKVYFCCHPEDFKHFFESISEEILAKQSCSVWYLGKEEAVYDEQFFHDLSQMQLFVIPITSRFLKTKNSALDIEFRFAVDNHIPILPLIREQGVTELFNKICGDIQYLDKYNKDDTAINYDEKLKKFLSSVLIGDELAQKIRDAFDAYVFLSYRKKDRRYAQELMRLIHKNDFCRDIAIWYDEFLVPGENFNIAIKEALLKSDLFVLAVTPNLINEKNYIMTVEYPMAMEEGKPILPAQMIETDKELLSFSYKNLPECTNARNEDELSAALLDNFKSIAIRENDDDARHLYFIGLAYLNGIDVEVDRERAFSLITAAAQKDLPQAIEQLINMYSNGDGVKRDLDIAIKWRKKLVDVTYKIYLENKDIDHALPYINACFLLGNSYYSINKYQDAQICLQELAFTCSFMPMEFSCDKYALINLRYHESNSYGVLGQIALANSEHDKALEFFEKTIRISEAINNELNDVYLFRDLSCHYKNIAMLYAVKADTDKAMEFFEKALEMQELLCSSSDKIQFRFDESHTNFRIAALWAARADFERSRLYCKKAIAILDKLISEYGDRDFIYWKAIFSLTLMESYRGMADFENAFLIIEEIKSYEKRYMELYSEPINYIICMRLLRTAQMHFQLRRYDLAIKYGEEAIAFNEKHNVITEEETATGNALVICVHTFVGQSYSIFKDTQQALNYCKKAYETVNTYVARNIRINFPDFISVYSCYSNILQSAEKFDEAEAVLKQAVSVMESYELDMSNLRDMISQFSLYQSLGNLYSCKENYKESFHYLHQAEEGFENLTGIFPHLADQIRPDYSTLCFIIAGTYCDADNILSSIKYYKKVTALLESIDEDKRLINEWELLTVSYYQLYSMSSFLKAREWKKKFFNAVYQLKTRFPNAYMQTETYALFKDTGIFD